MAPAGALPRSRARMRAWGRVVKGPGGAGAGMSEAQLARKSAPGSDREGI